MIDRFVVGLVGAPFGLEGFVKVKPLSGEIEHLLRLSSVVLRLNEKEQSCEIEKVSPVFQAVVMKFRGVDTPEAAGKYRGAEIITGRANASPLKSGEYYIEDLKGLEIVLAAEHAQSAEHVSVEHASAEHASVDGTVPVLGHINDIIEGGGGSLVEIRLNSGELKLVPFRDEFFGTIDIKAGRAVLLNRWILE
jgi:16S rRNA processing protein RimM